MKNGNEIRNASDAELEDRATQLYGFHGDEDNYSTIYRPDFDGEAKQIAREIEYRNQARFLAGGMPFMGSST